MTPCNPQCIRYIRQMVYFLCFLLAISATLMIASHYTYTQLRWNCGYRMYECHSFLTTIVHNTNKRYWKQSTKNTLTCLRGIIITRPSCLFWISDIRETPAVLYAFYFTEDTPLNFRDLFDSSDMNSFVYPLYGRDRQIPYPDYWKAHDECLHALILLRPWWLGKYKLIWCEQKFKKTGVTVISTGISVSTRQSPFFLTESNLY